MLNSSFKRILNTKKENEKKEEDRENKINMWGK